MNILFAPFPETVSVSGRDYRIVTDFREWIKLSELLQYTERFTVQVRDMILEWYIDPPPPDERESIYALTEFLAADAIHLESFREGSEEEPVDGAYTRRKRSLEGVYSFREDAICIYSAFRSVYGIDIESVPYMHWWKFLVLFEGLPANTEIKERIYYRSIDLNEVEDKEERKRIKKIKKQIALRKPNRVMDDYQIGDMFA
ncbi:Gp15 family bacteriophage protein [Lachnospiraceae bacterium 50-23]